MTNAEWGSGNGEWGSGNAEGGMGKSECGIRTRVKAGVLEYWSIGVLE